MSRAAPAGSGKGTPRVLWKGAISFGLVHIPVALYAATVNHGIDFDWLDKRSMDPVGYKRINKRTGREIEREQIVKGVEYEDGQYVVLSDKEIADAYPRSTQTIEIESFVPAESVPFVFLERPYYLAPINRGGKVYALLRETLQRSGRVGLARVVISSRQHLAMLVPSGPGMVLNLLRWSEDLRPWKALPLPPESMKAAGVTDRELKMATELIKDMSADFDPEAFHDSFTEQIMALVKRKAEAGKTESVSQPGPMEEEGPGASAKVVDLTELLQRSLRQGGRGGSGAHKAQTKRGSGDESTREAKAEPKAATKTRRASTRKTAPAARKRA
ncbi:Ku protein [Variovorax sp. OV329]|uniref:non-homologous end joining protein Ku n=1 Tax=Variovorax sp. OV329 TaxID=1882825 RepID=UPI000B899FC7|nr:Ku protein [Variovorax sp. OV329]